jgi:hypothetical protein
VVQHKVAIQVTNPPHPQAMEPVMHFSLVAKVLVTNITRHHPTVDLVLVLKEVVVASKLVLNNKAFREHPWLVVLNIVLVVLNNNHLHQQLMQLMLKVFLKILIRKLSDDQLLEVHKH